MDSPPVFLDWQIMPWIPPLNMSDFFVNGDLWLLDLPSAHLEKEPANSVILLFSTFWLLALYGSINIYLNT